MLCGAPKAHEVCSLIKSTKPVSEMLARRGTSSLARKKALLRPLLPLEAHAPFRSLQNDEITPQKRSITFILRNRGLTTTRRNFYLSPSILMGQFVHRQDALRALNNR